MNNNKCKIDRKHCENCGSTDPSDLAGDSGYTDCCNELTAYSASECRAHHVW